MSEPRQRARPKGSQFPTSELSSLLTAFGDSIPTSTFPNNTPLPETIRVLDEIITDYILETCHIAAIPAQLSHRSKIKLDDFKFALRKDPRKLGRMTELLGLQKEIQRKRRAFEVEEQVQGRGIVDGEEGGKKRGRGRGRKKKIKEEDADADGGEDGEGDAGSVGGTSVGKKRKMEVGSDGD